MTVPSFAAYAAAGGDALLARLAAMEEPPSLAGLIATDPRAKVRRLAHELSGQARVAAAFAAQPQGGA